MLGGQRCQRLRFGQKAAVIADEIDDGQMGLVAGLAHAQATTELLQEHNRRRRGTQHQDDVDVGNIQSLVEDVDAADHLHVTGAKGVEGCGARSRAWLAVDAARLDSALDKELRHEVGVRRRTAERERPPLRG